MLLDRPREKFRTWEKTKAVARSSSAKIVCTFPQAFVPNPGAQAKLFEHVPLDPKTPCTCSYRWLWYRGGINCFSGNTLINGIPAGDLANQGQDQLVDTLFGRTCASPVYRKGSADLYRVQTRSGKMVEVTLRHRFLTPKGFRQLQSLHLGEFVAVHDSDDAALTWERSIDYLDYYFRDSRPCDGLLPPSVVVALDKLQQLRKTVCDSNVSVFLDLAPCLNSNSCWDEIVSIDTIGNGDFYDISVPFANHFLANDIWHHNSGKSFGGAGFISARALEDPNSRSLITANSYGQLRTSTLVALAEFCKAFKIPLAPVADVDIDFPEWADLTAERIANKRFCTVFGAPILVLSAEAFTGRTERSTETGRGLQVRSVWADEFAYAEESAFTTINGRLGRGPGNLNALGLITSSINKNRPYNWTYNLFDDPERDESKIRLFLSIQGSSRENIHASSDYVESMMAGMSATLAKIELEAEYAITSEGRVYPDFDRVENNCKTVAEPDEVLHIGVDFNLGINAAIVCVIRNGHPRVVAEHWGTRDTPALVIQLQQAYPIHSSAGRICVYPDASGKARSRTNANISDIALLRQGGFVVKAREANPFVADRVASVNAMIRNAKGERKLLVNVKCCPKLTGALEKQVYTEKLEPDKTSGFDHYEEALGYFIHFCFALQSSSSRASGIPVY